MRYAASHKARTRHRIVTTAARRFRQKGFGGAGVDEVMESAGLTAGAFYGHFGSKQDLLTETLSAGLPSTVERLTAGLEPLDGAAFLREVVRRYLSRSHREDVAEGCALPALTAEVGRQGLRARKAFEAYVRGIVRSLQGKAPAAPGLSPEDRMLATVALFAGGLMLARAVHDEPLSDRILRACRRLAVPEAYAGETPRPPGEEPPRP